MNISIEAGHYAWKPVIIKEVVDEYGYAFWLDAGCIVKHPLVGFFDVVYQDGLFPAITQIFYFVGFVSMPSPNSIRTWTYPSMISYFNASHVLNGTNCSGGINGWDKSIPKAYKVIKM